MGRNIVRCHFNSQLKPEILFGHNSADVIQEIASGVNDIIEKGVFLQGTVLDAEVSVQLILTHIADALLHLPGPCGELRPSGPYRTLPAVLLRTREGLTFTSVLRRFPTPSESMPRYGMHLCAFLLAFFCFIFPSYASHRSLTASTNGHQVHLTLSASLPNNTLHITSISERWLTKSLPMHIMVRSSRAS